MKLFHVKQLNKVDTTKYKEGSVFLTKQSIAMLHDGKMEQLVKKSDIKQLVRKELKKVKKENE